MSLSTRQLWPGLVVGLIFTLVTTWMTWAEHETFNSTSLDMAVYTQLVWNAGQGRPFETTLLLQNRLHLAEHLALLLLPIAPLYALIPEVKLLLLLQQIGLGLSGLPVYWLARRGLGAWSALVLVGCYYAMPSLAEVALDAFYPIVFVALPVGWATVLAIRQRPRGAAVASLLAVLIEEEAALLAIGVGLFLLLAPRARRIGGVLAVVGCLWLGLAQAIVLPRYGQPGLAGEVSRAAGHFDELLANPMAWSGFVALNRLEPDFARRFRSPGAADRTESCAVPGQCSALRWWLYPTAGLALLSPSTLMITAPPAAALLLADKPGRFRRHWVAPMLPVIWIAVAVGLGRSRSRRWLMAGGLLVMVAATLLFHRADSSLPLGGQYEASDVVPHEAAADLDRLGDAISPGASVVASRRGLAHLANRHQLYVFPARDYGPSLWPPAERPDFYLLDLRNTDTVRELAGPASPLRADPPYREVARTQNALLLGPP